MPVIPYGFFLDYALVPVPTFLGARRSELTAGALPPPPLLQYGHGDMNGVL